LKQNTTYLHHEIIKGLIEAFVGDAMAEERVNTGKDICYWGEECGVNSYLEEGESRQTTHVDVDFTYYGRKIRIGFDVEFTCEVSASGYINLNVNGNNLEVSLRQSSPFTPLSREIFEDTFNYIVERFDDMFKKLGMIIEEDQACSNI